MLLLLLPLLLGLAPLVPLLLLLVLLPLATAGADRVVFAPPVALLAPLPVPAEDVEETPEDAAAFEAKRAATVMAAWIFGWTGWRSPKTRTT